MEVNGWMDGGERKSRGGKVQGCSSETKSFNVDHVDNPVNSINYVMNVMG